LSSNLTYTCRNNEGPWGDKKSNSLIASYNAIDNKLPTGQVYMITPGTWPGGGAQSVNSDEWTFNAIQSNSGANADTRSIKIKVKYGF
jgi:hypothetical protein